MMMIKEATNSIILIMVFALICYLFYIIEYILNYMLLPDLVPLFWFLFALVTPFWSSVLLYMLMT